MSDDYGRTLLHQAILNGAPPGAIIVLIEYGADPFAPDEFGDTPFIEVLYRLDLLEVLVELLSDSRSKEYRDGKGRAAIHIIAARSYDLLESMIGFGHDVEAYDDEGLTPLAFSVSTDYRDADLSAQALLEMGADIEVIDIFGWTPLMHAARARNEFAQEILLLYGADPHAFDGNGQNVLCPAAAVLRWNLSAH